MASPSLEKLKVLTDELNQKDKALRQTQKTLNSFFEHSIDLLSISDFNGKFLRTNPAWEKVLGWTQVELCSIPYIELIHPEDVESTKIVQQSLSSGDNVVYFRNRYRCKNGSYKILCWTAFPNMQDKVIYAIARDFSAMMNKLSE
jgi:PAS domain S-box-containing protein